MSAKSHKNSGKTGNKSKTVFLVIAAFFLVLLCVYPDNNLFTWIAARRTIRTQEKEIRKYQQDIIEMDARIKELSSTKDSLEQFARERFHFTVPGEDVYLIDD